MSDKEIALELTKLAISEEKPKPTSANQVDNSQYIYNTILETYKTYYNAIRDLTE